MLGALCAQACALEPADGEDVPQEEVAGSALALVSGPPVGLAAMTDFEGLSRLRTDAWAGSQSSFDRSGGNADRANYLYVDGSGDNVMLDQIGPGCVYRMWFTGQRGASLLKVYFDGETTPRIKKRMDEVFAGTNAPFLRPLVLDDGMSSGGFVSYVPLCFASSIRITTNDPNAYYNIGFHTFAPDTQISTFTGNENSSVARELWRKVGDDPKSDAGNTVVQGTKNLAASATATLLDVAGPRQVSSIKLSVPGVFPDQGILPPVTDDGRAHKGTSQFRMQISSSNKGVLLRRRLDHTIANQSARVFVDGALVGTWSNPGSNDVDSWLDSDFSIPSSFTAGKSSILVTVAFQSSDVDWNEFRYWAFSKGTTSNTQTDELDVGNTSSESAHSYSITSAAWQGTHTYTYPPSLSATDDGRAHRSSSQFTASIDPNNRGLVLQRRMDYGIGDQTAKVWVDGVAVGVWFTSGSDPTDRWRDAGFRIPGSFTQGKSSVKIKLTYVSSAEDWNEFHYWVYSVVDAQKKLTDQLDVGNSASENAHAYSLSGETWSGSRAYSYPSSTDQAAVLNKTWIQAYWDGEGTPSVSAPIGAFFSVGTDGPTGARGLAAGMLEDGTLYMYFPMPFASRARIVLENKSTGSVSGLQYEVRHKAFAGTFDGIGKFHANFRTVVPSTADDDVLFLDTASAGQVVGVVQVASGPNDRSYLEGDERLLVDDNRSPSVHGTGTEDFYNGGWYFDRGPFATPTHGNPRHRATSASDTTVMYRQLMSDLMPFRRHIRLSIEHGRTNDVSSNSWLLVYFYARPTSLVWSDSLAVGDASSERAHSYGISSQTWSGTRSYSFEGDFDDTTFTSTGRAHTGTSQFTLAIASDNQGVVLRRLFDQGIANQKARVFVNGALVGTWYKAGLNATKRWREEDFVIPSSFTAGKSSITVTVKMVSSAEDWNEFQYKAYSIVP